MKPVKPDPASRRFITTGEVIGALDRPGIHAWRGIPYAAAPVGALRWCAPRAASPWEGTRPCLEHGPMAPQYGGLLAPVPASAHGHVVGQEDCLNLNVFAPAWEPDQVPGPGQQRAVMLWIHGGGLAVGTSASYDVVRNYVQHEDVLVVTINYRLGILGWFTHPALAADGASAEERSGNFGLLDCIAALQWVRSHIGSFGGDPDKVTIFGESAGAQMVLLLLASPLATGLFHRAIAQSPVTMSASLEEAVKRNDHLLDCQRASSEELTLRLWCKAFPQLTEQSALTQIASLSPQQLASFLRTRTSEQLLAVVEPGTAGIYLTPRPTRDGVVLPQAPLTEVFASGKWNRVPVIIGSNRDEYRTFIADKPEHVRFIGPLPVLRDRTAYQLESGYLSRAWRAAHVDSIADAMLQGGHEDVWSYRFDWDEELRLPLVRPDLLLGACHAVEMAFAFGDLDGEFDPFRVNTIFNRSGRHYLALAMRQAWTSFARDAHPRLPQPMRWPRRTLSGQEESLILDSPRDGGIRMARARQNMMQILQAITTDSHIPTPQMRCQIYARLYVWSPLFAGYADQADYQRWCAELDCHIAASQFRPRLQI
ncbi:carboxylesterase/lipase family protein [Herbaspirillum sp. B65]|uniref:carboxylesterase/lipase family protein n=1 Tax=Herbaspirillum sp. B65 TaxID=137708 RepID=UPI000A06AF1D|nr:carboxylesterase family protein [Herbaspirillum sp. B65]